MAEPLGVELKYDEEADVLYITIVPPRPGEPSYCEEIDDLLLVERGYFSHSIVGFRLLDFKHHPREDVIASMEGFIEREKERLNEVDESFNQQVLPRLAEV